MAPCIAGSLAVMGEADLIQYVDALFEERLGGFSSVIKRHILLRSWLFGHADECRVPAQNTIAVPEAMQGFVGNGGQVTIRVQIECDNGFGNDRHAGVYGSYWATPDEEGRIALPQKLARFVGDEAVVCLSLMQDSVWAFPDADAFSDYIDEVFNDKFGGQKPKSRERKLLTAALKGGAYFAPVEDDCALRIPEELIEIAPLARDVVVVGVGDHVEVYSAAAWAGVCSEVGRF